MKDENSEKSPRERLSDAAVNLFYKQGYPNTGVNQLIEESSTFKKSFYRYYPGKGDLGQEYLRRQEQVFLGYLGVLMKKYPVYEDFIRAWMRFMRREIRAGAYRGCAFANFTAQTHDTDEYFRKTLHGIIAHWTGELEDYIKGCDLGGRKLNEAEAKRFSLRLLYTFEGLVQLFMMTGDEVYMKHMEEELLALGQA